VKADLICTLCPMGCSLRVEHDDRRVFATEGNRCKRGLEYAEHEIFHPERVVTTTVRILGGGPPLLPVKTARGVPKALCVPVVMEASRLIVHAPIKAGEVILPDILNTGVELIATRSIEASEKE
jgi:CxxC motif-containing protein